MPSAQTAQKTLLVSVVVHLLPYEHICLWCCCSLTAVIYLLIPWSLPHYSLLMVFFLKYPAGIPPFLIFRRYMLVTFVIGLTFLPCGCELVQVYHHHPRSRVPLDPLYQIIYLDDCLVWALPWGLELMQFPLLVGRAGDPHFDALMVTCAVGQSVVTSFHPVTGQPQMLAGIIVDVV
jgi:hypothetical protein